MVKQENRGRKPINPEMKKVAVQVYVEQLYIDKLGGMKKTKNKLLNFLRYDQKTIRNSKLEA